MDLYKHDIIKLSLTKEYAPTWYYVIYRILGLPFSYVFYKLRINPNLMSILSLILAILAVPYYLKLAPLAILLFNLSIIIDYSDGVVARLLNKQSKSGAFLDCMIDKISFYLLVASISLGFFIATGELMVLVAGALVIVVREFKLYSHFFLRKIFGDNLLENEKNKIKHKSKFVNQAVSRLIDLFYVLFPFIILFNYAVVLLYYSLFILVELSKMLFEIYAVISKQNLTVK